jgi:TolB protein
MNDLKDRLEREMQGLPVSTGGLERTLARVRRRDRNRRLVAGFVVLALVGASVLLLVRTWGSRTPIPADQPPDPTPAALGSLAYAVDGDIFVAEGDGSSAVRIADGRPPEQCGEENGFSTGEYWAEGSIWSPDGRYLAYRHANCDIPGNFRWHVVISDTQGNVLAEFPGEGWGISWSPDSTRVAVWVNLFETIGVFGVDGERQALLAVPHSGGDHDPVWLPDGESLLVSEVVVPIDGSAPYLLPLPGTYSPDGSRVAYVDRRSLLVAEADGSKPQEVFEDFAADPLWSPTGDRIAFLSWVSRPYSSNGQLRVLDVETGTVTLLAEGEKGDFLSVIDFSPEGDRILFSMSEDDVSSLWSINADGSDLRRLVAGTAWGDWHSLTQTP